MLMRTGTVIPFVPGGENAITALYAPGLRPAGETLTFTAALPPPVMLTGVGFTETKLPPVLMVTVPATDVDDTPALLSVNCCV